MDLISREDLFSRYPKKMLYVGFLKASDTWFPLSSVSDPQSEGKLDTLLVSPSYPLMNDLVTDFSGRIPQVQGHFVHLLMHDEISNLMDTYGLESVALAAIDVEGHSCSCGCGCD